MLGIYNFRRSKGKAKDVELINVIWDFTNKDKFPRLAKIKDKELEEAREFERFINNYFNTYFSALEFKMSFKVITYKEFINTINLKNIDIETYNYLYKRYMI